jgi:hypothetical protein
MNSQAPELDLVGTAEAARILGDLDKSTVTRLAASGQLPIAARLPGLRGAFLFHRADVKRLAAQRAIADGGRS